MANSKKNTASSATAKAANSNSAAGKPAAEKKPAVKKVVNNSAKETHIADKLSTIVSRRVWPD